MNVNIEHYKVFSSVVKHKNMTKAAEELMISQPAITRTIKTLETELGGTLFIRSTKGLELTAEGEMLYEKVKTALDILNDAENLFDEYSELKTGEIKIGISTVLTKVILVDAIKEFKAKYPGVKITIVNGLTSDLIHMMNKGMLDFIIYNDIENANNVSIEEALKRINYVFIYNEKFFKIDDYHEIYEKPFILQKKGSNTRKCFDSYMNIFNIKVNESMEVTSHELVCEFVKQGLGVGFVYEEIADKHGLQKIQPATLAYNQVYLSRNKNILTKASKEFIKIIKAHC